MPWEHFHTDAHAAYVNDTLTFVPFPDQGMNYARTAVVGSRVCMLYPESDFDINISNGEASIEPTIAKGFKEILIAASAYLENVVLFTNGYVLPARIIQLIADLGNVSVQISVDGMEETHNRIRGGRNAFRKTRKIGRASCRERV